MPRFFLSGLVAKVRIPAPLFPVFWPYGLLLLVIIGLYGQSLSFGYIWDDGSLFLNNTLLREGAWSWSAVARPILPGTPYFRPLVLSTWMAEMQLFQLTPLYSHAVNVAIHSINTWLLYAIACRVFEQRQAGCWPALVAALLYTAHPCLVEAVAWISGRFDLLATTLLMAGCVVALAPATWVRSLLVGLFSLGAMLSKETGVLFAPILVLLTIARQPARPIYVTLHSLWPYLLAYALAAMLYFILRSRGLGFTSYTEFGWAQIASAVLRYEVWLRTLSFYTFMSFMPFSGISPRHDLLLELTSYRQHLGSLAAAFLLLVVVMVGALRRRAWAMLWLGFYVGIFPVLGIFAVMKGETIGAERFLYLPLAMLTLALVALFLSIYDRYARSRTLIVLGIALAGGWLALSLFVTYTVTSMWQSGLRLWSWQYHINPDNTLVRTSYLMALSQATSAEAQAEFNREIERIRGLHGGRLPMDVQIVYSSYLLVRNDPEALYYLQGLAENVPNTRRNVNGRYTSGQDDVTYSGVLANYSQALMIFRGDLEEARRYLLQAQALSPPGTEYQIIHQLIALEYLEGNDSTALDLYKKHLDVLHAYNIHKMHESMRTLVAYTCLRKHGDDCGVQADHFLTYLQENLGTALRLK